MQALGEGLQSPAVVEPQALERREEPKRLVRLFRELLHHIKALEGKLQMGATSTAEMLST